MATTLTNPVATVTLAGTAERISLPSTYSWVWVRNDTDAAVYISQADDVGEGVSGSVAIPAGGAARLALTGDSFYAVGTGAVQIVAANYTDCPFKAAPAVSGGGSESGKSVMTLIGKFAATQGQWTSIGVLEAGTRLFIESAVLSAQATTTPSACTMHGYTLVPAPNEYQNLYFKVIMASASGVVQMLMAIQPNGNVQLTGTSASGVLGAFNVYKVEVPTTA